MKIAVLGAGAWGTALAVSAAGQHRVKLWSRSATQAEVMAADKVNAAYLPGVGLPAALLLAGGADRFASTVDRQDLIIVATPMSSLPYTRKVAL